MSSPRFAVALVLFVKAIFVTATLALDAFSRFRGPIQLICPKTGRPVTVQVDNRYAAASSAVGPVRFRLTACSRWPEEQRCGRECTNQL